MESRDGVGIVGDFQGYRDIEIRTSGMADISQLRDIDTEAFEELAYPDFVLRQFLDVHHDSLLVAVHDTGVVGYSLGVTTIDRSAGWLLALAVRAGHRGRGYGRALTNATLALLRSHAVRTTYLTVAPGNTPALGLYRSVGFSTLREARDHLGAGHDRLIMSLDLATAA